MVDEAQDVDLSQQNVELRAKSRLSFSTFSSLGYRDYRYLWLGTIFSSAGQWIEMVTLSWLVYDLTNSALMLGIINGLRAVPFLIFSPFGGVAADRLERRMLMMSTQAVPMASTFIMAVLILTGRVEVWHIFVFTFVNGIAWSLNQPVRMSLVPNLVPSHALMNAIALNSSAFNITRIIGPTIAGVLIGIVGTGGNFVIQGIAYVCVMAMIYLIRVPANRSSAKDSSIMSNLLEGMRYVWREQMVLTLMVLALIPQIFAMPYATLMPIFAKDVLDIGPEGLGLLMSAPGFGALAGTLILASLSNFRRKGALLIGATMALGISLILFGASRSLPLSMVFLVAVGGTFMAYMATNNTMLQILIPDEVRGRVMSLYMLNQGLAPAGSLMAGAMAGVEGAPMTTELMGALVFLLAVGVLFKVPKIRKLE